MAITIKRDGAELVFVANDVDICRTNNGRSTGATSWEDEMDTSEMRSWAESGGWTIEDAVDRTGSQEYTWRRQWTNVSDTTQELDGRFELKTVYEPEWTLIPAVSYGGNERGDGEEPAGLTKNGIPWTFAANRSSVPAATYSESEAHGWSVSLFANDDPQSLSGSCALAPNEEAVVHQLLWPEQERPQSYIARDTYEPGWREERYLSPGEQFEVTFHVVFRPVEVARTAWRNMLNRAWEWYNHDVKSWYAPERIWELGIAFAQDILWQDGEFTGFNMGVGLEDGEWVSKHRHEIGWVGQNGALATACIQDYIWHGNEKSLAVGTETLDEWARKAPLNSGLFKTRFNTGELFTETPSAVGETWADKVDTCNLAHGAYQFLYGVELMDAVDRPRPRWRDIALDVCDFFVNHQLSDGTFGKTWSEEGECLDETGSIGSFLLWPLLKVYRITNDAQYLDTAVEAFEAYAQQDLAAVACTAGALDINCIDKETAWPLAMAAFDLYEITDDDHYLEWADAAAYYLASWQWHYSAPIPDHTMLDEIDYDTFGGTSVAVQHQCQDPWGAFIAWPWLRAAEVTNEDIWRERAVAAWNQATIGISDGDLTIDGIPRPIGGQDETFMNTYWGWPNTAVGQGDVSRWLPAWPTAFRLQTLMHWDDWDVLQ